MQNIGARQKRKICLDFSISFALKDTDNIASAYLYTIDAQTKNKREGRGQERGGKRQL